MTAFKLTDVGKKVLAITLVIGILFIIIGAVINATGSGSSLDNGTNDYESNDRVLYLYSTGYPTSCSVDSYEYYEIKFSPSSSGDYIFHIDNGYLSNLSREYSSSVSYSYYSDYEYDNSYSVYLSSGYEYTFRIYTESYNIRYEIEWR